MSFFNTIHATGQELARRRYKADSQEQVILDYYKKHSDRKLGPSDIWRVLYSHDRLLIISVRRAITNLTNSGWLIKLTGMQDGMSDQEHLWIYNPTAR